MLTPSDIETIKTQLKVMQAHKEAMDKAMEHIEALLSKNQEPKKTGLGQQAIAARDARMVKKVV
jgi:hypothetical protein